jgi:hypothetical protein
VRRCRHGRDRGQHRPRLKDHPNIRALLAKAGAVPLLAVQLVGPSAAAGVDATALFLNISISTREQLAFAPDLLDALRAAATVHSLLCPEAHRSTIGATR